MKRRGDNICALCGSIKSYKFSKLRNKNGNWDGKSYKCETCRGLLKNYGTIDKEKIRQLQDQYKDAKHKSLVRNRACCICGRKETFKRTNSKEDWYRHIDNNGDWTGEWMCSLCYCKEYQKHPDSQNNIFKSIAKSRIGELSIYDNNGLGIIGEAVVAKVRNLEIVSIKLDKFNAKFDLSPDKEYNIIQVKTRNILEIFGNYNIYECWQLHFNKDFDNLFILCMSEDMKNIERLYIIPKEELSYLSSVRIYKSNSKWEKFRTDDSVCRLYNEIFISFMTLLNGRKYFSIDDIKNWIIKMVRPEKYL